MNAHLKAQMAVTFQTAILNADGTTAKINPPRKNLLLDGGLDLVATNKIADCFKYEAVGTGTTPTNRDSSTTTISFSGGTATASGNFFEASDVGRLIKLDTGEEAYITAYTDALTVTIDNAATVAAAEGTIWYVNEIGHGAETKRTITYTNSNTENGSTYAGGILTLKRTFLFSAETGPRTYREIGWAPENSGQLFGRALVGGAGDSLIAGQQYKVTVELHLSLTPVTPTAAADVGNNGFSTAGTAMIERIYEGISCVSGQSTQLLTPGATISDGGAEAFQWGQTRAYIYLQAFSQPASPSLNPADSPAAATAVLDEKTPAAYAAGSRTVTYAFFWGTTEANGTIYGIGFGSRRFFSILFDTPQTKDSNHTITATYRFSWDRTLVN